MAQTDSVANCCPSFYLNWQFSVSFPFPNNRLKNNSHSSSLSLFLGCFSPRFSFSLNQFLHNSFIPFFLNFSKLRRQILENARIRLVLLSPSDVTSNYAWAHFKRILGQTSTIPSLSLYLLSFPPQRV